MEFREFAWAQQLYRQRVIYGAAAEATENSYPKYPAAALRELVRQSLHPHNLEPLLLTLARPANADTRRRLAEVAGELVLVERALGDAQICEDLQVVAGGRVECAPDGMLYPDKATQTPYEVWVRVEMLDVLATMLREGVVRSLTPVMQSKLVNDLLSRALDASRPPLLRGYAMRAAHAATVASNAVRPDIARATVAAAAAVTSPAKGPPAAANDGIAVAGGGSDAPSVYVRAGVAALQLAIGAPAPSAAGAGSNGAALRSVDSDGSAASGASGAQDNGAAAASAPKQHNPYVSDPFERLKLLSTACQALYLAVAGPDAAPPAPGAAAAAAAAAGAAPLLARAVEAAAAALADQRAFGAAALDRVGEEPVVDKEKAAAGELSFDENWAEFLKAGFAAPLVGTEAAAVVAFGGALLQLLGGGGDGGTGSGSNAMAWPRQEAIAQLLAGVDGGAANPLAEALHGAAVALQGGPASGGGVPSIAKLPAFAALTAAAFARRCDQCAQREEPRTVLKRCGACVRAYYCSEKCQKAAWSGGHKVACKQLQLAAAGAGAATKAPA